MNYDLTRRQQPHSHRDRHQLLHGGFVSGMPHRVKAWLVKWAAKSENTLFS